MENYDIIQKLHAMQTAIRPSAKLQKRLVLVGAHLPSHKTSKLPLFAFRGGIIVASILLVILFAGSGIVAAATLSNPGSFLFPVKRAVIQAEIHFTSNPVKKQELQNLIYQNIHVASPSPLLIKPTPTAEPTITAMPTKKIQENHDRNHEDNVKGINTQSTVAPQQDNHGESKEKSNDHRGSDNVFDSGIQFIINSFQGRQNHDD